tara:strand:+ start:111 stop:944 length:834 start_codon:yes stop_codon:yes gene_type:complete
MKQNSIAIIYDFDGTLTPKTMQEYTLLPRLGIKSKNFWEDILLETKKTGAETMMVYMRHLLDCATEKKLSISKSEFLKMSKDIEYYDGVTSWFNKINKYVENKSNSKIKIHHYIISAGHLEILEGISIKKHIKKIFASEYYYNKRDIAVFPKIVVTDTTKTQYLFRINKGKENLADSINEHMEETKRPIPFDNMIYIGDGLTDVPSMALIKKEGGHSIAVYQNNKNQIKISESLLKANRVDFIAPADFGEKSILYENMQYLLDYVIAKIKYRLKLQS